MERRTALAIAAATAATVMAGSAAFAANVGLLQHDKAPPISVLDTSAVSPELPADPKVVTVVVQDPPITADGPATVAPPADATAASFDDHGEDGTEVDDHGDDDSVDDSSGRGSDDDHEAGHDDDD
jgi:hypothetical protein